MTASTSVLLVMAICVGTAYSLTCYTCASQSNNTACMTQTNCSANSTSCMTSVVTVGIGSLSASTITKTCSPTCTPSGFNAVVLTTQVSCCNTSLCNTSGANSVTSTYTPLAVALGFVGILLRSSSI
ncbi:lymphocyte antigen 6E-like [Pseudophryne corroboree]|uniref:lymphocyte antigen 6E-like n=1 Tax=Pseudophryne corroboree TaxID=495146 RepID=UPI003081A19D